MTAHGVSRQLLARFLRGWSWWPAAIRACEFRSTAPVIVHSQPFIEEYAVADPVIAVVTSDAAGAGTLTVGPVDGSEPPRTLADNSVISQLKSSGPGGLLGFCFDPVVWPGANSPWWASPIRSSGGWQVDQGIRIRW
jgi:hypothetical protein